MNLRTLEPTEIHMGSSSDTMLHIHVHAIKDEPDWKLKGEIWSLTLYDSGFGWAWFMGDPHEFTADQAGAWELYWKGEPDETRFLLKFYESPRETHGAIFLEGEDLPKKLLADHHTYSNERLAKVKEEHPFLLPPDEKPTSVNFLDSSFRTWDHGKIHEAARAGHIDISMDRISRWQ